MKYKEIMRATPNTLHTYDNMMLLAHTLHEKDGRHYEIISSFKEDCVILRVEVETSRP